MNGVWTSKDGTKHVIAEMEDSHLGNSIEMLQRRYVLLTKAREQINNSISELQVEKLRRLNVKAAKARADKLNAKVEKKAKLQTTDGRKFR